jgi:hypothetical protein
MRLLRFGDKTDSCKGRSAISRCKRIRQRLADSARHRFGPEAPWVQSHVAGCPRCQKRLAAMARVDLALSAIKAQPHRLDLLMRANSAAIRMLNHPLREAARDRRLEEATPEPRFIEKCAAYRAAILNVAACVAILFLTKAGIFSSFDKARSGGQAVMKQYYAAQAGEDLAGEVFKS